MNLSRSVVRHALAGRSVNRIAALTGLPHAEVERIRAASPEWHECVVERDEARRRRDDARRRLLSSDIGRAPSYLFLASKRDALGHVDWASVHGFEPWQDEIDQDLYARPAP
jgi:hypothetical protein